MQLTEEPTLVSLADAYRAYANHATRGSNQEWLVGGTVALWGRVIEGTRGYRAERAYPAQLWLLPPAVFGPEDLKQAAELGGDLIRSLRSRYGVTVGYAIHAQEWNALLARPTIGMFFRWRLSHTGSDILAAALDRIGEPSADPPTVADALQLHLAEGPSGYPESETAHVHLVPRSATYP